MKVVNLYSDEWDDDSAWPKPEQYEKKWRGLGSKLGAGKMGGSLYELPPGAKTFPYHWHHGTEELLIVLDGRPTLRTSDGERELERGDVVSFPTGPEGAHQVWNATEEPSRIAILSTIVEYEIVHYPDSDKVGMRAEDFRLVVRPDAGLDYWEGES
jgi:uncharacterized cupin superfamily protein